MSQPTEERRGELCGIWVRMKTPPRSPVLLCLLASSVFCRTGSGKVARRTAVKAQSVREAALFLLRPEVDATQLHGLRFGSKRGK